MHTAGELSSPHRTPPTTERFAPPDRAPHGRIKSLVNKEGTDNPSEKSPCAQGQYGHGCERATVSGKCIVVKVTKMLKGPVQ